MINKISVEHDVWPASLLKRLFELVHRKLKDTDEYRMTENFQWQRGSFKNLYRESRSFKSADLFKLIEHYKPRCKCDVNVMLQIFKQNHLFQHKDIGVFYKDIKRVVILNLSGEATFRLSKCAEQFDWEVKPGTVVVMEKDAITEWDHGVPVMTLGRTNIVLRYLPKNG